MNTKLDTMEEYRFPTSPVADSASVVQGPNYRFTVLMDGLVRYEWAPDDQFEDRPSTFAIHRKQPVPDFKVMDFDDVLEIVTNRFHLVFVKRLGFSPNSLTVQSRGAIAQWGTMWRYGEGDEHDSNLRGTARTLDTANGAIPLGEGILSRRGYASIDDSGTMLFDSKGWVAPRRPGKGRIDGYVFAYAHDFREAMRAFYAVSGPQPSLPRWALGNWWSRFEKYTADSYTELMTQFRDEKIPLSVGVIDMDWHLVNSPEVMKSGSTGWTGYTWNRELFPDHPAFLEKLHSDFKLKVTLNDHPADGVYSYEDAYEEMAKALGHDTTYKTPIQFDPTSPAFIKTFLQILHRNLEKEGVDFWWIDWQQGPFSRIPGIDPLWLLNHFHFLDNSLYPPPFCPGAASKPMIFSRFAGPGSHRYPLGFSGDSVTTWASLDFQPYFTLTASNIGYGWWSHDIGGHMNGSRDDELVTRWVQLGCLSPVLRLHSTDSPWMGKEPWGYAAEPRDVLTKWLRFRHRLLPYIGSWNIAMSQDGVGWPLVQPMYWDYPGIEVAYQCKNQYFFGGPNVIVVPITTPAHPKTRMAQVKTWIPPPMQGEKPARWVDIFTGLIYDCDQEVVMYRSLNQCPILAKEGSIIPLDKSEAPANGCENPTGFEILVVVGRDGKFEILEEEVDDQGQDSASSVGSLRSIPITWTQDSATLKIGPSTKSSSPSTRDYSIRFISLTSIPESSITASHDSKTLSDISVTITKSPPAISPSESYPIFTCDSTLVNLSSVPFPLNSPLTVSLSSSSSTSTSITGQTLSSAPTAISPTLAATQPQDPNYRQVLSEETPHRSPSTCSVRSNHGHAPPPPRHSHGTSVPAPVPPHHASTSANSTSFSSSKSVTLDNLSPLPYIHKYLYHSQLDFALKSRIWNIINSSNSTTNPHAPPEKSGVGKDTMKKLVSVMAVEVGEKAGGQGSEGSVGKEEVLGPVVEILGACG